jgi:hypothetical protein
MIGYVGGNESKKVEERLRRLREVEKVEATASGH